MEHGGVTAGYECVEQKIKIADKELNRSYKEALERISNEASDLEDVFRSAQRAWLKFKDAECEFIGSSFTS
ncbi:TPA: lysozyme inhibitor LprI family protein [Photobacterium damselae]